VDFLYLDTLTFPVLRGSLSKLREETSAYCWCMEILCASSTKSEQTQECELHYLLGTEPYVYAQLLPLGVQAPDELIGRRYFFPQCPEDNPPAWEPDQWPFFCLYLWEHDYLYPTALAFTAQRGGQYRVEIEGQYPVDGKCYQLRVKAWLDWEQQAY
jgi:hypothetical protein